MRDLELVMNNCKLFLEKYNIFNILSYLHIIY